MSFSGNVDVGVELDIVDFGAHEAERLPTGLDLDSRPLARPAQLAARRELSSELRPYFARGPGSATCHSSASSLPAVPRALASVDPDRSVNASIRSVSAA